MNICPLCGLPREACVCEQLAKTKQKIRVKRIKGKFWNPKNPKYMTVVSGLDPSVDMKKLAKELKTEFACGGTVKNSEIELQGDHLKKVKEKMVKFGFPEESISIEG